MNDLFFLYKEVKIRPIALVTKENYQELKMKVNGTSDELGEDAFYLNHEVVTYGDYIEQFGENYYEKVKDPSSFLKLSPFYKEENNG